VLSLDLTAQFGRGFSIRNLEQMRLFYLTWAIAQTVSAQSQKQLTTSASKKSQTASAPLSWSELAQAFPLPWSAYVRLLSVKDDYARHFYETEALRGGWSVRQLDRQIGSQFYERTALSKNKAAMLTKGAVAKPEDAITPDEAVKDPYVLELGGDFTFVGRQRRLRIDQTWYRVDLLFHRRLRCLVIIDLKLSSLTHADVGQMHMYCNYAKENWTLPDENPPVSVGCS
jgi:predicted nuclease of restriction endonuclease-like (RecB) superfamily